MHNIWNFIKNEDAMETIEFLVVLAVVAGLVSIAVSVGKAVKSKGTTVANNLDNYAKNGT